MTGLDVTLPIAWTWSSLKFVTTYLNRGIAPDYSDDGVVRAVGQAANQAAGLDWTRTRFHDYKGDATRLKGYLVPGDVLINSTGTGTLGRVGYFSGSPDALPCVADGHVTVARADGKVVDSRFLYYWLTSRPFYDYIYSALIVGATNQIELNRERLAAAPIVLPPVDDQREIAGFLDAETRRIDGLMGAQRAALQLLRERRSRLLEELLIQGEGSAPWAPLGTLTQYGRPIMYGIVLPGPNVAEGVPIVKGGDVAAGRLSLAQLNKTTFEIESGYARSRLRAGDLVISIRGSVGEVAVVPVEIEGANLTQDAARIAPGDAVIQRWLELVLQSPSIERQIQSKITGATIKGINIWDLCRVLVPRVSLANQRAAVKSADSALAAMDELVCKIESQVSLLAERRQALITAAVTGQFDVSTARGVAV
jgi:type I restriction enzyme, S subunit